MVRESLGKRLLNLPILSDLMFGLTYQNTYDTILFSNNNGIQASDDYIAQMAALFRDTLNLNLIIYLEWSNEPWNSVFEVTQDSYTIGQQLYNTGNYPFLDYDSILVNHCILVI